MILLIKGEPLGGKGLTGPIVISLCLKCIMPIIHKAYTVPQQKLEKMFQMFFHASSITHPDSSGHMLLCNGTVMHMRPDMSALINNTNPTSATLQTDCTLSTTQFKPDLLAKL